MMFFDKLFRRKHKKHNPQMLAWEEIVEMMRDKQLDSFSDEVEKVIYSKDMSIRYVILKDENGLFTFQLEAIYQFDENEWRYISLIDNNIPAMWEPFRGFVGKSVFESVDDLLKALKCEPEYKQYFE